MKLRGYEFTKPWSKDSVKLRNYEAMKLNYEAVKPRDIIRREPDTQTAAFPTP